METINKIWSELEKDNSINNGLLFRRYSTEAIPDILVAIHFPEKSFCLAIKLSEHHIPNITSFSNLKEISLELITDIHFQNHKLLLLKLNNVQHKEIFAVLCDDLINSILLETNEKLIIKKLLNQLEKWKSLFSKLTENGLSSEEQQGLYGELFFLKKFLENNEDFINVVTSWVGPGKENRDFQYGSWGCEIKTTHGNNHQKVFISNERQLDTSNLEWLFLNHISLDVSHNSGETLNEIIESISNILQIDLIALNQFKMKLMVSGYFETHRIQYENIGYFIRNDNFYSIHDKFPRIEENELKQGVGDVKYSIILSHCQSYIIDNSFLFSTLIFRD